MDWDEHRSLWLSVEQGMQRLRELDNIISTRRASSALRTKVQTQIDTFHQLASELEKRLNPCTPLLRLPGEVLRHILSILADIWPPVCSHCIDNSDTSRSLGWIAVGHVCQGLRSVLLSHQALWVEVVCVFPEAQSEILHRAGALSIPIQLSNIQCIHTASRVQFMLDNISRAHSVHIEHTHATPQAIDKWPLDPAALAGQEFPALETFELLLDSSSYHWQLVTDDIFELPSLRAPRLKSLRLGDFYFPFDANTLTSLNLERTSHHPLPSPPQFLVMLSSCVQLQTLTLKSWVPELMPAAKPTISLPSLHQLFITDNIHRCIGLWSHIDVPAATQCSFDMSILSAEDARTGAYFDDITPHTKRILRLPIQGISIFRAIDVGSIGLAFLMHSAEGELSWPGIFGKNFQPPLLDITLRFRGDGSILLCKHALAYALEVVDIAHVQYLEVGTNAEGDDIYTSDEGRAMLSQFANVHTLYHENTPELLLVALSPASPASTPLLPSLRNLWLSSLNVSKNETPGSLSRSKLINILLSRKRIGSAIQRLRIEDLVMDESEARKTLLPRLRAIVARVECGLDKSILDEAFA